MTAATWSVEGTALSAMVLWQPIKTDPRPPWGVRSREQT
jgi:hypothetical protein